MAHTNLCANNAHRWEFCIAPLRFYAAYSVRQSLNICAVIGECNLASDRQQLKIKLCFKIMEISSVDENENIVRCLLYAELWVLLRKHMKAHEPVADSLEIKIVFSILKWATWSTWVMQRLFRFYIFEDIVRQIVINSHQPLPCKRRDSPVNKWIARGTYMGALSDIHSKSNSLFRCPSRSILLAPAWACTLSSLYLRKCTCSAWHDMMMIMDVGWSCSTHQTIRHHTR